MFYFLNKATPEMTRNNRVIGVTETLAKDKSVVVVGVYYPPLHESLRSKHLGVTSAPIHNFKGLRVGETLELGDGRQTSPIVEIVCLCESTSFLVYRCETESDSLYDVIVAV